MNKRAPIKTTVAQAVDYWSQRVDECDLSVDWAEADTHCWRCGCERNLERCHIVPDSLDGADEPSNIVLLCKRCHAEGPNVADPEIMWDWIRAYKVPFYGTFWGIMGQKEYRFLYGRSVANDLTDILRQAGIDPAGEDAAEIVRQTVQAVTERCSVHFGQPYFNVSTIAGQYRMMVKALAKHYQVPLPERGGTGIGKKLPWWYNIE